MHEKHRCVEPVGAALETCKEKSSSKMDELASALEKGFTSIGNFAAPIEKSVVGFLDTRVTPKLREVAKWGDSKLSAEGKARLQSHSRPFAPPGVIDKEAEDKEA
jgi:hypothetical protein